MPDTKKVPDATPDIKILPDGSYDLRGATRAQVGAALDDYSFKTDPRLIALTEDQRKKIKTRWTKIDALLERFPFLERILLFLS